MTDTASLIARLEKATGPDRTADADIDALVHGGVPAKRAPQSWQRSYGDAAIFTDGVGGLRHTRNAPAYTSSINAAMTLVPEGWFVRVTQIRFGMWHCELWCGDKSTREIPDAESIAASESLARSAAAMKARSLT